MQFLRRKNVIIAIIVAIVLLAIGGTVFVLNNHSQKSTQQPSQMLGDMPEVPTLTPDQIGLTITLRPDNKAMKFAIANAKGITDIEYTIAYTANQKGQEVQQGLIGQIAPDAGQTSVETAYREFGTCSSGVCRYDTVVSPITLTLKITKSDGTVYQVTKTITLPQ